MRNGIVVFVLGAVALAAPAWAQSSQLPAPSPIEKELAARASNFTEVTLGKNMLAFAAKFMNGKDEDEAATRHLIEGLDGVYVREYEFDKEGEFSMEEADQLRKYFETGEWSPIVHEHDRKNNETTDVMVKMVNGVTQGMFIYEVAPKELTIVLILGPIRMEDLDKLKGVAGLSALGDVEKNSVKDKEKPKSKDKPKDKEKDKDGGPQ